MKTDTCLDILIFKNNIEYGWMYPFNVIARIYRFADVKSSVLKELRKLTLKNEESFVNEYPDEDEKQEYNLRSREVVNANFKFPSYENRNQ